MAKNFSKGIDRVFSPTVEHENVFRTTVKELDETIKEVKVTEQVPVPSATKEAKTENSKKKSDGKTIVGYNILYPKDLQKRIKRFCIEHDGIDMKDVFTQGAEMFMREFKEFKEFKEGDENGK